MSRPVWRTVGAFFAVAPGRAVPAQAWALVAIAALILASVNLLGWHATWKHFVSAQEQWFGDVQLIVRSAEAAARGYDPMVFNLGVARLNYPRVWQHAATLFGWSERTLIPFAVFAVVLPGLTALILLLRHRPSWVLLLFCCSSAVALGFERGNIDVLMFALVLLSAFMLGPAGDVLRFVATVLKLFPLFAQLTLTVLRKRWSALAASIGAVLYIVLIRDQLTLIRQGTPAGCPDSYGVSACSQWLSVSIAPVLGIDAQRMPLVALVAALAWCAIGAALGFRSSRRADPATTQMYLAGSSIFVGSFFLGANFDYRLIFLLLCVPLWLGPGIKPQWATLICLGLALNHHHLTTWIDTHGFRAGFLAKWLLLAPVAKGAIELLRGSQIESSSLSPPRSSPATGT